MLLLVSWHIILVLDRSRKHLQNEAWQPLDRCFTVAVHNSLLTQELDSSWSLVQECPLLVQIRKCTFRSFLFFLLFLLLLSFISPHLHQIICLLNHLTLTYDSFQPKNAPNWRNEPEFPTTWQRTNFNIISSDTSLLADCKWPVFV